MTWLAERLIGSAFGRGILAALGILVALGLALRRARRAGAADRDETHELERLRAADETRRRIYEASTGTGDPDDDREWLFRRGQRPGR